MTKDLTRGTPWKLIVQFALPIMAGNLLQQLYNTADTIIVGNFNGQQALSAVGACASLTVLFTALAIGFSIGAAPFSGRSSLRSASSSIRSIKIPLGSPARCPPAFPLLKPGLSCRRIKLRSPSFRVRRPAFPA